MSAMAAIGVGAPLTTTLRRATRSRPIIAPSVSDTEALLKAEEKRQRKQVKKERLNS